MKKATIKLLTVGAMLFLSAIVFGCAFNFFEADSDDETEINSDDDNDDNDENPDPATDTTDDDDDTANADDDDDSGPISGRLVDNGDGTATDGETGLIWQNPPTENYFTWQQAIEHCQSLNLEGQTDWRLPTIGELRSLIRDCPPTIVGGGCAVDDECLAASCRDSSCGGCAGDQPCYWDATLVGECAWYWSSSVQSDDDNNAWDVMYDNSYFANDNKSSTFNVRCVR